MPQSYVDYIEAYVAIYSKQFPPASSIGSALGCRQALQGEPIEPCYVVTAKVAALALETAPE